MKIQHAVKVIPAALVSVGLLGCADSGGDYQEVTPEAAKAAADSHDHDHDHDHAHAHGPNGGDLVELGDHSIHAEVVFDEGSGKFDVYLLGEDAKTAHPIDLTEITLSFAHGDESEDFTLAAAPLDGEAEATSSRFTIMDEEIAEEFHEHTDGAHLHFSIDGKEYKGEVHHHHDHAGHDHDDHADHDHGDEAHNEAEDKDGGHKDDGEHKESEAAAAEPKPEEAAAEEKKPESEVVEE